MITKKNYRDTSDRGVNLYSILITNILSAHRTVALNKCTRKSEHFRWYRYQRFIIHTLKPLLRPIRNVIYELSSTSFGNFSVHFPKHFIFGFLSETFVYSSVFKRNVRSVGDPVDVSVTWSSYYPFSIWNRDPYEHKFKTEMLNNRPIPILTSNWKHKGVKKSGHFNYIFKDGV